MRSFSIVLLFLLIGCTPSENPATLMSQQIQQWVPAGTPLATARQIMEQHGFTCTAASYDNKAAMPPGSDTIRWDTGIMKNGRPTAVTNISILDCNWTDTNISRKYEVSLTAINGETEGIWTVNSHPK